MSRSSPASGELLAGDRVGGAQHLEALGGDLADDADAEAGAGERLAPDDALGHAELEADLAHLVLEQRPQRLDQLELQVVRQPADVVVALDVRRAGAAAGLDHVGVERALHEELDRVAVGVGGPDDVARRLLEDADELAADDLALLLGVGDPGERGEELLARVDDDEVDPGRGDEVLLDLLGLAGAQQPVVDEHAGELVTDRPLHERRGHGGVDATGQAAQHPGRRRPARGSRRPGRRRRWPRSSRPSSPAPRCRKFSSTRWP